MGSPRSRARRLTMADPDAQHVQNWVQCFTRNNRLRFSLGSRVSEVTFGSFVTAMTGSGEISIAPHDVQSTDTSAPRPSSSNYNSEPARGIHSLGAPTLPPIPPLGDWPRNFPHVGPSAEVLSSDPSSSREDEIPSVGHERRTRCPGMGFSILSLDGGGCRGYLTLLVLKNVLRLLQPEELIYPYLWFDLISGTSTGGLIAILLAELHLDIDTAIRLYQDLARDIFAKGYSYLRYLVTDSGYCRRPLERAIATIIKDHGESREYMEDSTYYRGCRCFVTTTHCVGERRAVMPVRSYRIAGEAQPIPDGHQWTCTDAALAAASAPSIFKRHWIARGKQNFGFEDAGAHGANNPARITYDECRKLDTADETIKAAENSLFISLGTGTRGASIHPASGCFGLFKNKKAIVKVSARHCTNVSAVHEWMKEEAKKSTMSYFRLNPPLAGKIDLDDWKQTAAMEDSVRQYFEENKQLFRDCADRLNKFQTGQRRRSQA